MFCGSLTDAATGGAITHGQCPSFYADAGDQARIDDLVLRWFDRYLRDLPVDTGPPVEYRTNTGDWHAESWPPPATHTLTVPVEGTALTPSTPASGLGILALPAVPGSPTAVTVAADAPELAGRQVEVVGQPTATLSATGTGLGAHLYARLIDSTQGELPAGGSAVNNQETPMRLGALSTEAQQLEQPLVGAAYTYAPDAPVTVQVDTQSLMYTFPRTGPAQIDLAGQVTIPYRTLVADRVGGPDRIATAAELSRDSVLTSDTVVLATATDYPDALAGAPLATSLRAPLLLTGPDALADQARREILRTGATTAVLLGGEVDGVDVTRSAATHELVETTAFDRLVLAGLTAALGDAAAEQLRQAADVGTPPVQ